MIIIHVTPDDDTVGHEHDQDCVCGPAITEGWTLDGELRAVQIDHHSGDGREHTERTLTAHLQRLAARFGLAPARPGWTVTSYDTDAPVAPDLPEPTPNVS